MSEVTTEPRSTDSMASTASVASSSSRRKKRSKKAALLVSNTENVGEKSPEHALLRRSQGTVSTDSIASLASEISVVSDASDADRETQLPIDLDDMNISSDSDSEKSDYENAIGHGIGSRGLSLCFGKNGRPVWRYFY